MEGNGTITYSSTTEGYQSQKNSEKKIAIYPEVDILWEVITTETVGTVTVPRPSTNRQAALIVPKPAKVRTLLTSLQSLGKLTQNLPNETLSSYLQTFINNNLSRLDLISKYEDWFQTTNHVIAQSKNI